MGVFGKPLKRAILHGVLTLCLFFCPFDVDLEKNVHHAQLQWFLPLWKGATNEDYSA